MTQEEILSKLKIVSEALDEEKQKNKELEIKYAVARSKAGKFDQFIKIFNIPSELRKLYPTEPIMIEDGEYKIPKPNQKNIVIGKVVETADSN